MDQTVAPVSIDGIAPTLKNVKHGIYTVARGLFSNTKGTPSGLIKKVIDFLFSPEGQEIIKSKGFIPVQQSDSL